MLLSAGGGHLKVVAAAVESQLRALLLSGLPVSAPMHARVDSSYGGISLVLSLTRAYWDKMQGLGELCIS